MFDFEQNRRGKPLVFLLIMDLPAPFVVVVVGILLARVIASPEVSFTQRELCNKFAVSPGRSF